MSVEDLPPALLAKHPELREVGEALRAHAKGQPITTRCPKCGALITVTEVPETGALLVACGKGHVLFRANRTRRDQRHRS